MAKTKPKYEYYSVCIGGAESGMRTLIGDPRNKVSKLEHKFGEGTIVIGISEDRDRHQGTVIEPILKLFTFEFGTYELVKKSNWY